MSINALIELLRQHIGLDPESIGREAIEQGIKRRMVVAGTDDPKHYFINVSEDPLELSALVDEITVGETWFFREHGAFSVLHEKALSCRTRCNALSPFRVASMPCSSGEEAYSIVMALFNVGFQENQFVVDGYDISTVAMSKARKAEYGKVSFRGTMPDFSKPYFRKHGDGFCLKQSVKQCVNFHQENLLRLTNNAESPLYDVIFCRNFLIYLDADGRRSMAEVLQRSLAKDGILMVGHCEAPSIARLGFKVLARDKRFAFCKMDKNAQVCSSSAPKKTFPGAVSSKTLFAEKSRKQGANKPAADRLGKVAAPQKRTAVLPVSQQKLTPSFTKQTAELVQKVAEKGKISGSSSTVIDDCKERLDAIKQLADSGKLEKAKDACRNLMRQHEENVEVQFMMGLISETAGEWASASQYFRKVLYLHPEHQEALLHSAIVCEYQGEMIKAENLRTRLSRLIS